jgi:hypothetical protein
MLNEVTVMREVFLNWLLFFLVGLYFLILSLALFSLFAAIVLP